MPDAKLASEVNQESLNKYSRHPSVLRIRVWQKKKKQLLLSPCLTGRGFDLQANGAANRKRVVEGPGAGHPPPHPGHKRLWSVTCPASPGDLRS